MNWYNSLWRVLQAYHDLPGPTGLSPHRILFLRDRVSRTLPWLNHGKVARDANAMMAEADDTAAKVCKALQDEHEKRAKYFKQGKVPKYALQDTSFVPEHQTPADVLSPSSSRPAMWTRTTRVRTTTSPPRGSWQTSRTRTRWKGFAASRDSWEPPSSFVPRYTTVWMDYLKKKNISFDVKDVLVHVVAAVAP